MFVPVSAAPEMMRAVGGLGLEKSGIKLVSTMDLVPDQQLLSMGDAVKGLVTSGTYSAVADRPQNKAFVAAWQRAYGADALPDFTAVQGWDAMDAVFAVVKQAGGKFDGDQALAILKHWKNPESPRGLSKSIRRRMISSRTSISVALKMSAPSFRTSNSPPFPR